MDLPRFGGSPAILMIERIQSIDLLWDRTEDAVKRYLIPYARSATVAKLSGSSSIEEASAILRAV